MVDVLEGWQEHNAHILKSLKPGKDDAFLLETSLADATQGFCTPPMDRARFLKEIQNQPHLLIPHCGITQSSGKQRVIDNFDTGGQSDLGRQQVDLVLTSPASSSWCWQDGPVRRLNSSSRPMLGKQGKRIYPRPTDSAPCPRPSPWDVWWFGTTVIGTSRPISYTPGCCLAFLLQSLRSTASPAYWRACAVVLVEF